MIAYLAILGTSLGALAGAPWWTLLFAATVLTMLSLMEQRKYRLRFASVGASDVLTMAAWQSAGHALLAAGAAWGLGTIFGLIAKTI